MEENRISKHYADIADKYDDLYSFTYDYIAEFAVRHMDLEVDDLLADIGAGTGGVTSLIWKKAGLNNPVLCVDPSLDMINVAEKREGLKTCLATADGFFDGKHQSECISGIYNKLVFVGSANLLPEPSITFRKAFEYLPSHGLLLVVQRSTECTLPLWESIMKRFYSITRSVDGYKDLLEHVGFEVTLSVETGTTKMTKHDWYDKLRKRMFTLFSELSDDEIEEGIKEVDQCWFNDKGNSDIVEIRDTLVYFIASKKQSLS